MDKIKKIEEMIDQLIYLIVNNDVFRSPKTEEKLTALCLARQYMLDKIKQQKIDTENRGENEG